MGAACGGVWSDKAKELSSALPLPLRREVGGGHTGPQGSNPAGAGRHRHLPPHPGSSPRCTLTSGWWAGDCWLGWTSSGHSPKEVGGNRTVAKAIVLLRSPWQPLPWTAPHQCLAAVAQATHGLSWLLRLRGTQDLGKGGGKGSTCRPQAARQQRWRGQGEIICPLPGTAAPVATSLGLGACLG